MATGSSFQQHTHSTHQLAWASSGVLTIFAEDRTWLLPPTRALWIPAGVAHAVLSAGRATMTALYFPPGRWGP